MERLRNFIKKSFTPITIILIPHNNFKTLNLRVPIMYLFLIILLCLTSSFYIFSVAVRTIEYESMKAKLSYYQNQFNEIKSTITAIKKAEIEFKRILSLGLREKILESINYSGDSGSIEIESLKEEIKNTMITVQSIREYLKNQKNLYLATPKGLPIEGKITSAFGLRKNPFTEKTDFHSGVDISAPNGTPIKATADGVVVFSGRTAGNGYLVIIEHGFGYSTLYAHNRLNVVKVGQQVKRGDVIAYSGSTGNATGPHLHYEIWKDGKPVNPLLYVEGGSENVSQKN